jgi:hypothetical protein
MWCLVFELFAPDALFLPAAVVNATTNGTSTSTPAWLQGDQTLQAQIFSAKAAGYGGFILLLYFLLAGIYCMCYMPIKKVG